MRSITDKDKKINQNQWSTTNMRIWSEISPVGCRSLILIYFLIFIINRSHFLSKISLILKWFFMTLFFCSYSFSFAPLLIEPISPVCLTILSFSSLILYTAFHTLLLHFFFIFNFIFISILIFILIFISFWGSSR